jgi:uncharacterized membrane protein
MDTKKLVVGTLAGGVAYFVLGFIIYAILMEDFFAAHTVKGIMKSETEMKYYPMVAGNLAHAALLSFIFLKWANIKTFSGGLQAGAIIGFFMAAGFDLITYDTAKIMSIIGTLTDIVVYTIMTGLVGGVVGAVLGMGNKE